MRVLFVTGEFPPQQGGVGDCTSRLAQALNAKGALVNVLTCRLNEPQSDQVGGIQVQRRISKWDWSMIPILAFALEEAGADILHIQYQTGAFGMHPAINLTPRLYRRSRSRLPYGQGARTVVTFHDLRVPYLFPKAGRLREWVTFELARSADAVVATNPSDRDRLSKKMGKPADLIPIGSNIPVDPPSGFDRSTWRQHLGIRDSETLLCYFGFMNASKGAGELVRAFAAALARGIPARLLMLGGQVGASDPTDAIYLERVKDLVTELGVDSKVLWTGYLAPQQVSAALLASDLCVLPYRDGASFRRGSLMAALAHGRAIVTSSGQSEPWSFRKDSNEAGQPVLTDGENAVLVPAGDPEALATAIVRVAADPALRSRLGMAARKTAEFFTWPRIADAHLELYARLGSRGK